MRSRPQIVVAHFTWLLALKACWVGSDKRLTVDVCSHTQPELTQLLKSDKLAEQMVKMVQIG